MIAVLFLLFVFLHGLITTHLFLKTNIIIKLIASFIFGSVLCLTPLYYLSCLFGSLPIPLVLFFFFSILLFLIFHKQYIQAATSLQKIERIQIGFLCIGLLFSYWLFSKTFGYDTVHGNLLVTSNVYVDFGAHIPFIRSFSLGNNFPGEVPFFQNTGLLYYFLFDFYTGVIEHLGLRIDIAYNLLSSFSFVSLLFLIYHVSVVVFKKRSVGFLSVAFFLLPSNFSFVTFFQKNGLSFSTISSWWHNSFYLEGHPTFLYKTIEVAGFWNLNPYVNQRHLIFGLGFFLLFMYLWMVDIKKNLPRLPILFGILLGLLVMWHTMIFIAIYMVAISMIFLYKDIRKQLFLTLLIGGCIALPQLTLIKLHSANTLVLQPGFLLEHMITVQNEVIFWLINLGVGSITIPLGFFLSNKKQKKFFLTLLPLFIIPNLIHLSSRSTFDDHKYFNVWIVGASMFSAYITVWLFSKKLIGKFLACMCIALLCLAGVISIMVIKNDIFVPITDYPKNTFLQKVIQKIPPKSTVITNGEIYDPIGLVGKKMFVGRIEYIFVYGGNIGDRLEVQKNILHPASQKQLLEEVRKNHIQYIVVYKNNFAKNEKSFDSSHYPFAKVYEDNNGIIYKI